MILVLALSGTHKAVSFWEDTLKLEGGGEEAPTLMPFKIISKKKKMN